MLKSSTAQRRIVLCFVTVVLLQMFASAQVSRGTLTGTIRDPSGAVIPEITVSVTNTATGAKANAQTTNSGLYSLSGLQPGTYDLSIKVAGFREYLQTGITVSVGDTVTNDVSLSVGGTADRIEVRSDASLLKPDSSEISSTVSTQLVEDLPLNFGGSVRNPLQFLAITPGYSGNVAGDPLGGDPGFKINGGQEEGVDILYDGGTILHTGPSQGMNYGISADAVQEFRVVSNGFSAEYGRTSGAVVNLISKSGTNTFHGTAYDLIRNDAFNATGWLTNYQGQKKDKERQNDYGFNVGGPVTLPKIYNGKDKTFFFLNWEAFRLRSGGSGLTTMPIMAFRQGDFSRLPEFPVIDPQSCANGTCSQFTGNIIPKDRLSSVSQKLNALLPATTNDSLLQNTLQTTNSKTDVGRWTGKIDHNISDRQKLFFNYSSDDKENSGTSSFGPLFTNGAFSKAWYLRAGHDFTISPTMFNHLSLAFTRRHRFEGDGQGGFGQDIPGKIGLKGVADTTWPCVSIVNWSYGYGGQGCGASQFFDNTYEIHDSVSWIKGRHNMKFGFEMRKQQFNVQRLTYTTGRWEFRANQTSDPSIAGSGNPYASYMLGLPAYLELNGGRVLGERSAYYAGFAQDDFKVSRNLTLNIGLRYDVPRPTTESHDRLSWVDMTVPNPGAGNLPGAYVFAGSGPGRTGRSSAEDQWWKAIGPRLGVSYALGHNTVIRSAYGIYYTSLKVSGYSDFDSLGFFPGSNFYDATNTTAPVSFGKWDNGVPAQSRNISLSPTEALNSAGTTVYTPTGRPGTVQNWNFDVQQQLSKDVLLDVAYVGMHSDHLQAYMRDANQLNPAYMSKGSCLEADIASQASDPRCAGQGVVPLPYAGFSGSVRQALRPFPQYSNFNTENGFDPQPFGFSTYHALQVSLNKRFSGGLTAMVSYTWSKNLTDADHEFPSTSVWSYNAIGGPALNQYNQRAEKSLSELDVPHKFVAAYSYDLPFGPGKKLLTQGGVVGRIVGGWTFSGIISASSGIPWGVRATGSNPGTATQGTQRANVVSGVPMMTEGPHGYMDQLFNPAAFSEPAPYTYGNSARSYGALRAPQLMGKDMSLNKKIRIYESVNLNLRADFFNITNQHIFQVPQSNNNISDARNFGVLQDVSGPRNMLLSVRVDF